MSSNGSTRLARRLFLNNHKYKHNPAVRLQCRSISCLSRVSSFNNALHSKNNHYYQKNNNNNHQMNKTLKIHEISKPSFFTFVYQFQKAVVLTFGTYPVVKEPGIRLYIPAIQNLYRVDLRTRIYELPDQHIITRDNVSCAVNAVVFFHIFDAYKSCFKVDNVNAGVMQMGQTELRDLLCRKSFNQILESRGEISDNIAANMAEKCAEWGVKIEHFQLKNIDLTQDNMIRAMAKEAEATRERTAAMIRADGEYQAAKKLTMAAKVLKSKPLAVELRQLQTLERLAKETHQTTVIVPNEVFNKTDSLFGAGIGAAIGQSKVKFDEQLDDAFKPS